MRHELMRMAGRVAFAAAMLVGCSMAPTTKGDGDGDGDNRRTEGASAAPPVITLTDVPGVVVQRKPRVQLSHAESSLALRDIPASTREVEEVDHEPLRRPSRGTSMSIIPRDPVHQSERPSVSLPAALLDFAGQGRSTSPNTITGVPPDTNGAVGPNHYVQTVNGGIAIWNKTGTIVQASRLTQVLWTGYVGTNAGNGCADNNDGDPVVVYDQLADRWFITQFSLPNATSGPNFQCVAVSKTPDPTGAYWLYDFSYAGLNDYGKFGVWPDAYYATFNMFDQSKPADQRFRGADFCAYDRVSMLAGKPATQQCFMQDFVMGPPCALDAGPPPQQPFAVGGALPISMDGKIAPPIGTPGFFVQFDYSQCAPPYNQLDLWKMHVDFATPTNTKLTGPIVVSVADFTPTCYANGTPNCIPQLGGRLIAGQDDRMMFRFNYRNFGTHESLLVNHGVVAGNTAGVRWYELRLPAGAPTLFQQGTYAPADGNWRWMASIAQDQAQGMALGFSISSATTNPSIAWTGRLASDAPGVFGQGESVVTAGTAHETGASRWGDYSNMTVDPVDDCTFWYTTEVYLTAQSWDTQIAAFKFPSCAANDFTIAVTPATQVVPRSGQATYKVTTTSAKGTAEAIALVVQDLPQGVTAAFAPATVTAGATSTLTLTASATAPFTTTPAPTFTVIGKAPAAVHAAKAQVAVSDVLPDAGSGDDGGGATVDGSIPGDSGDLADGASGNGANGSNDSGCGCRTVPSRVPSPAPLAFAALALMGAARWRRRRASSRSK